MLVKSRSRRSRSSASRACLRSCMTRFASSARAEATRSRSSIAGPLGNPELMGPEWTRMKVAQLRYDRSSSRWSLYCCDRNERWCRTTTSRRARASILCWPRSTPIPPGFSGAERTERRAFDRSRRRSGHVSTRPLRHEQACIPVPDDLHAYDLHTGDLVEVGILGIDRHVESARGRCDQGVEKLRPASCRRASATTSANSRATSSSTGSGASVSTSVRVRMRWARTDDSRPRTPMCRGCRSD